MQSGVEQKLVSGVHVHPISKNGLVCLIQGRVGKNNIYLRVTQHVTILCECGTVCDIVW